MSKIMLIVNLHEIEFLDEVLEVLAVSQVRDCVVQQVDSIPSHHPGAESEPNMLASVAGLFKAQHNVNYLILAVADETRTSEISSNLRSLRTEQLHACSFWFVPMQGYWYHKPVE